MVFREITSVCIENHKIEKYKNSELFIVKEGDTHNYRWALRS
jgi:hypothetical protein